MAKKLTIALAGNPNSGKTSIFNNLTGARQHVGNWPGVTVEKKEGKCKHNGYDIKVMDLPGTYSLTAYSIEEVVARDFIIKEKPDVVVDIVDASNLQRNLYLTTQLKELGASVVIALNMSDVAAARGIEFDLQLLSQLLGAPVVPTVGHKKEGITELLDAIISTAQSERSEPAHVNYGRELEEEIVGIADLIKSSNALSGQYEPCWLAIKLLENDKDLKERLASNCARRRPAHNRRPVSL